MKFYICNLGCKVNTYEANVMSENLIKNGFVEGTNDDCDIVIVNTCSVTDVAFKKSLKMVRRFKDKLVVVVGCASQVNCNVFKVFDFVKVIIGNSGKSDIVSYINKYLEFGKQIIDIRDLNNVEFENMKLNNFKQTRAFVKIEDGCENFCSYCIIPYTRGRVRSRSIASILDEVKCLVNNGHKEIVLTGIHTGHYNYEGKKLSYLLNLLGDIKELERIRISSIEITELDDDFLDVLKGNKKIVNHLHIPLQTGCDKVLKDMNRRYNMNYFFDRVLKIKGVRPSMNITTDVIVGYPTESDDDFKETLENIKKIGFGKVHVFPYSRREGTPAYLLDDFDSIVKSERCHKLLDLSLELENNFLNCHLNKRVNFLPEVYKDGFLIGHSDDYVLVKCKGSCDKLNCILNVNIIDVEYPYCIGEYDE